MGRFNLVLVWFSFLILIGVFLAHAEQDQNETYYGESEGEFEAEEVERGSWCVRVEGKCSKLRKCCNGNCSGEKCRPETSPSSNALSSFADSCSGKNFLIKDNIGRCIRLIKQPTELSLTTESCDPNDPYRNWKINIADSNTKTFKVVNANNEYTDACVNMFGKNNDDRVSITRCNGNYNSNIFENTNPTNNTFQLKSSAYSPRKCVSITYDGPNGAPRIYSYDCAEEHTNQYFILVGC